MRIKASLKAKSTASQAADRVQQANGKPYEQRPEQSPSLDGEELDHIESDERGHQSPHSSREGMNGHIVRLLADWGELGYPETPVDVSSGQGQPIAECSQVDSVNRIGEEEGDYGGELNAARQPANEKEIERIEKVSPDGCGDDPGDAWYDYRRNRDLSIGSLDTIIIAGHVLDLERHSRQVAESQYHPHPQHASENLVLPGEGKVR